VSLSIPAVEPRDRAAEKERDFCGGNDRVVRQTSELNRGSDKEAMLLRLLRHGIARGTEQARSATGQNCSSSGGSCYWPTPAGLPGCRRSVWARASYRLGRNPAAEHGSKTRPRRRGIEPPRASAGVATKAVRIALAQAIAAAEAISARPWPSASLDGSSWFYTLSGLVPRTERSIKSFKIPGTQRLT
jgi:hypothetical protein